MSDPDKSYWKYLFVLGALFVAGLSIYNSIPFSDPSTASNQEERSKEKKKKTKPLPDFLTRTPVLLPGIFQKNVSPNDETGNEDLLDLSEQVMTNPANSALRMNRVKAGHWYSVHYPVVANHFNVDGQLTAHTVLPTSQPVPVPHTRYWPIHKRPVALAKKEWKNLQTSIYVPVRTDLKSEASSVLVSLTLDQRNATLNQASTVQPVASMKAFQHHFVVLSDRPDSWSFLKLTDSFQLKGQLGSGELRPPFYHLIPSIPGDPVPVSRNPLQWTTVAYVLWDNLPADALDVDQQVAMIDWLHHGGQLIISGPDCLDKLQTSFLTDYLPASFDGSIILTADEVSTLNENWSIPSGRANQKRELTLAPTRPIPGVRFEPHPKSYFVDGTGEIAIERQIGRGRIVITSFSLASRRVRSWRSFQSFLNGALLRKPARKFKRNQNLETLFTYQDDATSIYDPLLASTVRFLSRDLGTSGTRQYVDVTVETPPPTSQNGFGFAAETNLAPAVFGSRNDSDSWHYGGYQDQPTAGVGGWNDFSGVAIAARQALREGAGIKPPSADFVLKMLGGYLLVLVPLNWLVFRFIGRVEFAWAAAPLIAIAGAIGVVRLASLDIGFVRSNTELGLLEVFADHSRAHHTQYSALYTSLTTRYKAKLDDATSQALPFAAGKFSQYGSSKEQTFSSVTLRRSVQNQLEDLQVQSNSTGLLHIESMLDIEGTFSISSDSNHLNGRPNMVHNSSTISLKSAGVIHRSADGKDYSVAWLGEFPPRSSSKLKFESANDEDYYHPWKLSKDLVSVSRRAKEIWDVNVPKNRSYISRSSILQFPEIQNNLSEYEQVMVLKEQSLEANGFSYEDFRNAFTTIERSKTPDVDLRGAGDLFDAVTENLILSPGESRLLAVTDQALSLGKLEPEATQTRRQTLVVVHLNRPKLPPARRDANAYQDKANMSDLDLEEEAQELDKSFEERIAE